MGSSIYTGAQGRIVVQGWPPLQSQCSMLTFVASPTCLLRAFLANTGLLISMQIPWEQGRHPLKAPTPC